MGGKKNKNKNKGQDAVKDLKDVAEVIKENEDQKADEEQKEETKVEEPKAEEQKAVEKPKQAEAENK
jgi:hypothetical protein